MNTHFYGFDIQSSNQICPIHKTEMLKLGGHINCKQCSIDSVAQSQKEHAHAVNTMVRKKHFEGAQIPSRHAESGFGNIGMKYPIPLPEVPNNLKLYICDIARYLLWKTKASDEVRQRYEDAIAFLKRVSDGKGILTIKVTDYAGGTKVQEADKSPSTMPIGTTYRGGVFGDDVLNNMPSI